MSRRRRRAGRDRRGTGRSALGERVAHATNGQDEGRRRRIVLDLLAQVADVDVDGLLVLVEGLVVAQQLEELATRVDAARPGCEVAQDFELRGGEADPSGATLDPPTLQVDDQVVVADDPPASRVREIAVRAPQERLDPAQELTQAERFREVVVRAELETN